MDFATVVERFGAARFLEAPNMSLLCTSCRKLDIPPETEDCFVGIHLYNILFYILVASTM